jgi:hypothetical protein
MSSTLQTRTEALLEGVARLALTAWAGATWAVVAWVAPAVFRVVEPDAGPVLAGDLAGVLFRGLAWGGLVAGLLTGYCWYRARRLDRLTLWVLLLAMAAPLVSENFLRPKMDIARAAAHAAGQLNASLNQAFAVLHGGSAVLYLLAGAALAWLVVRRAR